MADIHSMWTGAPLTRLELLTLASFTDHGHKFRLWLYEPISIQLPRGVFIENAADIIPRSQIFRREYEDPKRKLGKGSLGAPFSDLFRYKLIHKMGGWWVDMDVTCLRPLSHQDEYVFRCHNEMDVVGSVLKCPQGSRVLEDAYRDASHAATSTTLDWMVPNKILSGHVRALGLQSFIQTDISNLDLWDTIRSFMYSAVPLDPRWHVFHWCNELWRTHEIDKNTPTKDSTLHRLMIAHNV